MMGREVQAALLARVLPPLLLRSFMCVPVPQVYR